MARLFWNLKFASVSFSKMLSWQLKTCCPSIHGNPQWIKDVKDTRNFLAHNSNSRLTKDEYDTWLNTVEKATLNLAKVVSSTFLKIHHFNLISVGTIVSVFFFISPLAVI
jgi:hypothetical protein